MCCKGAIRHNPTCHFSACHRPSDAPCCTGQEDDHARCQDYGRECVFSKRHAMISSSGRQRWSQAGLIRLWSAVCRPEHIQFSHINCCKRAFCSCRWLYHQCSESVYLAHLLLLTCVCVCCSSRVLRVVLLCVQIRATMQQDLQNMKAVFRQTVFEKAPGARS